MIVHDTVYGSSITKEKVKQQTLSPRVPESVNPVLEEGLGVLSIDDLRGGANVLRGNSMEDDSLWRRFPQVAL